MSWLNIPVAIVDDYRVVTERQTYTIIIVSATVYRRSRKITWTRTRYVGCHYTAAKAFADALAAGSGVEDTDVVPAGGGQYHVICVVKVEGAWSSWESS
jgi:hypothetical protein